MNQHYESANIKEFWNYILYKHHLSAANPADSILQIVDSLIGLHSARLNTPYVTLKVRNPHFEFDDLTSLIHVEKKLIKLRCMRKTLHTVPIEFADIVHSATKKLRISLCKTYYLAHNKKQSEINQLKEKIISILEQHQSLDIASIIHLCRSDLIDQYFISNVVKELWEEGVLCYINLANKISKEKREYALSSTYYPKIKLNKLNSDEATEKLVLTYIHNFGPVTLKDIVWWTGLSKTKISAIITNHSDALTTIQLLPDAPHYMTIKDFEGFERFKKEKIPFVTNLLAYEDPTLKGYYESRFFYASQQNLQKSFNSIGEVKQTMMVDGGLVGLWEWDKKKRKIEPFYFIEVHKSKKELLTKQIKDMESFFIRNS